jgi:hypothetical protein
VAGSFGAKEQGLLRSLVILGGFLVDFCSVWSGYDLIIIIFSETEGPATILPMRRDCSTIYKNLWGLFAKGKEYGFSRI